MARMAAESVPRPWRRFMRFSVRRLIVLVLVVGAALGWIVRGARIQREAVSEIRRAGGTVKYNWDESNGMFIASHKPWAPGWLVNLVGVDYFGHVTTVGIGEPTDADCADRASEPTEVAFHRCVDR